MNNQRILEFFIDISFTLAKNSTWHAKNFTEFVVKVASYNTYVETLKSEDFPDPDTLHRRIGESSITIYHENFKKITNRYLKLMGKRKAILILDYTNEPFYGKSQSHWLHGYRPEKGSKGSYKFLVASILCEGRRYFVDCFPISLFTNPIKLIEKILDSLNLNIEVVLLDRGFASEAVLSLLEARKLHYLMLYPERRNVSKLLKLMRGNYLRLDFKLGSIDTKLVITREKTHDWIFITNLQLYHFCKYVRIYKLRWNIETGFRVKDEARIKSKSITIVTRYFFFLASLLLYNVWKYLNNTGYKITFKRFVITTIDLIGVEPILLNT